MSDQDNSYTKIPNDVLEAFFTTNLSGYESRILHLIIRKTYGWHKPKARIALRTIEQETGIPRCDAAKTLKRLRSRKIVGSNTRQQGVGNIPNSIWLNPNVSQWIRVVAIQPTPQKHPKVLGESPTGVGQISHKGVGDSTNLKRKERKYIKERETAPKREKQKDKKTKDELPPRRCIDCTNDYVPHRPGTERCPSCFKTYISRLKAEEIARSSIKSMDP